MKDKVLSIINNFNRHFEENNFVNLSIDDWKNIFSKELSNTFSTQPYNINPKWLYRARPNFDINHNSIDFFIKSSELWAPPQNLIKRQGRCNVVGQSLLYCSSDPTTTLFEIKPKTGTEITIMEYKSLGILGLLGVVGVKEIIKIGKDYQNIFSKHFKNSYDETKLIDDILSRVFKLKIDHSEKYPIYNLTNAISQIFLQQRSTAFLNANIKGTEFIGLIYPSVETSIVLGMNIALLPNKVNNILKPFKARKIKILKQHDQHYYEILITHQTKKIYPSGELAWELNHKSTIEYITDLPEKKV